MNATRQTNALIFLVTWCEQQLVDLRKRRKMLATGTSFAWELQLLGQKAGVSA